MNRIIVFFVVSFWIIVVGAFISDLMRVEEKAGSDVYFIIDEGASFSGEFFIPSEGKEDLYKVMAGARVPFYFEGVKKFELKVDETSQKARFRAEFFVPEGEVVKLAKVGKIGEPVYMWVQGGEEALSVKVTHAPLALTNPGLIPMVGAMALEIMWAVYFARQRRPS